MIQSKYDLIVKFISKMKYMYYETWRKEKFGEVIFCYCYEVLIKMREKEKSKCRNECITYIY